MQLRHLFESVEDFSKETNEITSQTKLGYFYWLYGGQKENQNILFSKHEENLLLVYALNLAQPPQKIIKFIIGEYKKLEVKLLFNADYYAETCRLRHAVLTKDEDFFNYLLEQDPLFQRNNLPANEINNLLYLSLANRKIPFIEKLLTQLNNKSLQTQINILVTCIAKEPLILQLYKFDDFKTNYAFNFIKEIFFHADINKENFHELLNVTDEDSKNLIHLMIMKSLNTEQLSLLFKFKSKNFNPTAYFWQPDEDGNAPMSLIVKSDKKEEAHALSCYLIEQFSVDRQSLLEQLNKPLDEKQNTILHHAYAAQNADAVDLLQRHGASPFLENIEKLRPIDVVQHCHKEFVEELGRLGLLAGQSLPVDFLAVLKQVQHYSDNVIFLVGTSFKNKLITQDEFDHDSQMIVDEKLSIIKLNILNQLSQQKIIANYQITIGAMLRLKIEVPPIEFEPTLNFLLAALLVHGKLKDYLFYLQYRPAQNAINFKDALVANQLREQLGLPIHVPFLNKEIDQTILPRDRGYMQEHLKTWQRDAQDFLNQLPECAIAREVNCSQQDFSLLVGLAVAWLLALGACIGSGILLFGNHKHFVNTNHAASNHTNTDKTQSNFSAGVFFGTFLFAAVLICGVLMTIVNVINCSITQSRLQDRLGRGEKTKIKKLLYSLVELLGVIEEDNLLKQKINSMKLKNLSTNY